MEMSFLKVLVGFDLETQKIAIDALRPSKNLPAGALSSRKFAQIKSSIQDVGLIEPLSVAKPDPNSPNFLLLDGHLRLMVLKSLGETEVPCLVAKDDESYTYNNRINRLSTIQEHYMLRRAIDRGVSKERLAKAFDLDVRSIDKRISLLDGVTAGAVVLLRDQQFNPEVARILRKMRPARQVEAVELMIAAQSITVSYAEALLSATPLEQRYPISAGGEKSALSPERIEKLEREMGKIHSQYQQAEQHYGADLLHLTLAKSYLGKLLTNDAVKRYLGMNHAAILSELESIVNTESLEVPPTFQGSGMYEETGEGSSDQPAPLLRIVGER